MKNKIFTKYFLLAAVTVIVFVILGGVFTVFMNEQLRTRRNMIPPLFIAKLIDKLDKKDKLKAIEMFEETQDAQMGSRLVLYDQNGQVVYNKTNQSMPNLNPEFLKQFNKPYDFFNSGNGDPEKEFMGPPPGGPGFFILGFFGGHPPPPPMGEGNTVIKLDGDPTYYLGMTMRPFGRPEGKERFLPTLGLLSLFISLLLGVGVTISLIYASVRKRVTEADLVISQIQRGNLKARFRISRKDEFGEAMLRFNKMADEIEALVNHLKDVESSRNKILQELAHDLRTPVASLKNLLETIESQNEKLTPDLRKELTQLSLREVDYFGQLVEDLLLLAQVDEPKYRVEENRVLLNEVVEEVISDCLVRPIYRDKKIKIDKIEGVQEAQILGSYSLLYRMFRNAFENSLSFANSQVMVGFKRIDDKTLSIVIYDDGPGLSNEQIMHFGERKLSRQIILGERGKRLSIGLGSVIIKKIAAIHRGEVSIKNNIDPTTQKIKGAILTIEFHDVKMT